MTREELLARLRFSEKRTGLVNLSTHLRTLIQDIEAEGVLDVQAPADITKAMGLSVQPGALDDLQHLSRANVRKLLEEAACLVFADPVIDVQNIDPGTFVVVIRGQRDGTKRFRVKVIEEK